MQHFMSIIDRAYAHRGQMGPMRPSAPGRWPLWCHAPRAGRKPAQRAQSRRPAQHVRRHEAPLRIPFLAVIVSPVRRKAASADMGEWRELRIGFASLAGFCAMFLSR
jgi:hypothetical protein